MNTSLLLNKLDDAIQYASDIELPEICSDLHDTYNELEALYHQHREQEMHTILLKAIDLLDVAKQRVDEGYLGRVFEELCEDLAVVNGTFEELTQLLSTHLKMLDKQSRVSA